MNKVRKDAMQAVEEGTRNLKGLKGKMEREKILIQVE